MNGVKKEDKKKQIISCIQGMAGRYSVYEIFADWVKVMALTFANQILYKQSRENEYVEVMKKYIESEQSKLFEMTAWLVEWADEEFYDMLGYIYMNLELGSKAAGQFFTPYHLCRLMAQMTEVKDGNIITVNEPTCGAGGNIIALAEAMKEKGINYQRLMRATCQDIDVKAVYMAYVQLTLYGIPAIVYQTDTLRDPNGVSSSTGKLYTFGWLMANAPA
jgi:type I restriction-modification system DNA methylase subunit